MIATNGFEHAVRRAARAHIVLGMDLEEAERAAIGEDRSEMLMLEARAGQAGDRMHRKASRKEGGRLPRHLCRPPPFPGIGAGVDWRIRSASASRDRHSGAGCWCRCR